MFSSLATLRADVDTIVRAAVPKTWRTVPNLATTSEALVPLVYTEFTELATSDPTGPLGPGTVYASLDLIVTDPKTTAAGETSVDGHIVALIGILDSRDDLNWSAAKKERLVNGVLAWRVTCHALVSTRESN